MRGIIGMKGLTKGRTVAMETIQDVLREEARDYQDLAAMKYIYLWRLSADYPFRPRMCQIQRECGELYAIARSALFELIGAMPEHPGVCGSDLA